MPNKMKHDLKILRDLEPIKEERQLKLEKNSDLENIIRTIRTGFSGMGEDDNLLEIFSELKITPKVIDTFIAELPLYEMEADFDKKSGAYLTALVQTAYNQGHNNFRLDLREIGKNSLTLVQNFGYKLTGQKNNRLKITLIPYWFLGWRIAQNAKYVNMRVLGNVVTLGDCAKNSNFYVSGGASGCGEYAKGCKFTVMEGSAYFLGKQAKSCRFTIYGGYRIVGGPTYDYDRDADWGVGAKNCVFRFDLETVAKGVNKNIGKGCRIYLVKRGEKDKLYFEK